MVGGTKNKNSCHCGQTWTDPNVKHYCKLIGDLHMAEKERGKELEASRSLGTLEPLGEALPEVRESASGGGGGALPPSPRRKHKAKPKKRANGAQAAGEGFGTGEAGAAANGGSKGGGGRPKEHAENIKVLVRLRPLLPAEVLGRGAGAAAAVEGRDTVTVDAGGEGAAARRVRCQYDRALGPETTQEEVYAEVADSTAGVVDGFNATVFAYGQTGSGKTHTMFGPGLRDPGVGGRITAASGVIPRAVADLFRLLGEADNLEYAVFCSFVQIYNEDLFDMLRDPRRGSPLTVHEDAQTGIFVQGLSEYAVRSVEDCVALIQVGEDHRAVRETHMNEFSSRSHSIFQLMVEQRRADDETGGEKTLRSKFNLVDLAGSERWDLRGAMAEEHVSEMTSINLSLYTLGRCIAALSNKRGNATHVPYRESKLTRLLQDSLGGNTATRLVATLSPASDCAEESLSTLRFADRARNVLVYLHQNEQRPVDYAVVLKLKKEIAHLRALLRDLADQSGGGNHVLVLEQQLFREREQVERLRAENAHLRGASQRNSREPSVGGGGGGGGDDEEEGGGGPGGFFVTQSAPVTAGNGAAAAEEKELSAASTRGLSLPAIPSATKLEGGGGGGKGAAAAAAAAAALPPPLDVSRRGGEGGAAPGAREREEWERMGAYITALEANNAVLADCLKSLHDTSRKFFTFEIEEEDLKNEIDRVMAQMTRLKAPRSPDLRRGPNRGGVLCSPGGGVGMTPKMAYLTATQQQALIPAGAAAAHGPRGHLGPAHPAASPAMGSPLGSGHARPPPTLGFRVRGKRADEMIHLLNGKNPQDAEDERKLKAELKKAKARMKKNKKLADFLKQKEDQKLLLEQQEEEEKRLQALAEKEKRRKFKEHQRRQKKKLERYYAELHAMAQDDDEVASSLDRTSPMPATPPGAAPPRRRGRKKQEEHRRAPAAASPGRRPPPSPIEGGGGGGAAAAAGAGGPGVGGDLQHVPTPAGAAAGHFPGADDVHFRGREEEGGDGAPLLPGGDRDGGGGASGAGGDVRASSNIYWSDPEDAGSLGDGDGDDPRYQEPLKYKTEGFPQASSFVEAGFTAGGDDAQFGQPTFYSTNSKGNLSGAV